MSRCTRCGGLLRKSYDSSTLKAFDACWDCGNEDYGTPEPLLDHTHYSEASQKGWLKRHKGKGCFGARLPVLGQRQSKNGR